MEVTSVKFQANREPYKECDKWKTVHSDLINGLQDPDSPDCTNSSCSLSQPTVGPECWKWKDSEKGINVRGPTLGKASLEV